MAALAAVFAALAPLLEIAAKAVQAQIQGTQGPSPAEVVAALKTARSAMDDAIATLEADLAKDDAAVDAEIKAGTLS